MYTKEDIYVEKSGTKQNQKHYKKCIFSCHIPNSSIYNPFEFAIICSKICVTWCCHINKIKLTLLLQICEIYDTNLEMPKLDFVVSPAQVF